MGILLDALVITLGGLLGGKIHKWINKENIDILGIGIIIVSLVGFFENVYNVKDSKLTSSSLVFVLIAFIVGSGIGKLLYMADKLSNLGKGDDARLNAVIDAFLFFWHRRASNFRSHSACYKRR